MVSALQEKTFEYIESLPGDNAGAEVIVKVYGDLFQLWQRYEETDSNLGSSDLTRFFSHFNRSEPLVDFIDIGPRKESIEKKLSGMSTLTSFISGEASWRIHRPDRFTGVLGYYLPDERCEHILLAVPYASIDPILSDHGSLCSPDNPDRITIIPPPFTSTRTRKSYDSLSYPTTSIFDSLFAEPPHPQVRKKHTRSPPPSAPVPPPAANVPKLRIRGGPAKIHERGPSPPRHVPFLRAPSPPMAFGHSGTGAPALGMPLMGPGKWTPMQLARMQQTTRSEFHRGMIEGGGMPSLRWP
jgi:hypothetical protein